VTAGAELPDFRRRVVRVRLDPPGPSARERIWARALIGPGPIAVLDGGAAAAGDGAGDAEGTFAAALREVGHRYAMTPRGIQRAAANARLFAAGRTPTVEDLHRGAAAEIQERFGGIATRVSVSQR